MICYLDDELDEDDFMHEVNIMKKLIHPKIVQLYGISTAEEPFYIITEFLKNGDLLTYLRKGLLLSVAVNFRSCCIIHNLLVFRW